jgi:hypothetical protein
MFVSISYSKNQIKHKFIISGCRMVLLHTRIRPFLSLDYMWLHIRGVGEWTNRLYNYFEREQEKLHNAEEQLAGNRQLVINGNPEPKGIKRLQA